MSTSFERPTWDEYFMLQAELAKLRSNCMTRQVGAVIVRDHRQIATGYNGTPLAITIGIKKIFSLNEYPETDYKLLEQSGVKIEKLDKERIHYWAKSLIGS